MDVEPMHELSISKAAGQRGEHPEDSTSKHQDDVSKPIPLRLHRLSCRRQGADAEAAILRAAVDQLVQRLAARNRRPGVGCGRAGPSTEEEQAASRTEILRRVTHLYAIGCGHSQAAGKACTAPQGSPILKPLPRKPVHVPLCRSSLPLPHDPTAPLFPLQPVAQPQPRLPEQQLRGRLAQDSTLPPVAAAGALSSPAQAELLELTQLEQGQASSHDTRTVDVLLECFPSSKRRRLSTAGGQERDVCELHPVEKAEDATEICAEICAVATPDQQESYTLAAQVSQPRSPSPTAGNAVFNTYEDGSLPSERAASITDAASTAKADSSQLKELPVLFEEATVLLPDWIANYSPAACHRTSFSAGHVLEQQSSPAGCKIDGRLEACPSGEIGEGTPLVYGERLSGDGDVFSDHLPVGAQPCSEHQETGQVTLRCRSTRVPGGTRLDHPAFQRLLAMIRGNSRIFEADGRILRLKQHMPSDANCAMIEAVIAALAVNTRVQALYIQNFERGMCNRQLELLTEVLRRRRIWALNIGENFLITLDAWQRFTDALPDTAVSYMYVSEHHLLRTDLKLQMRDAIRENRRRLPAPDPVVTSRVTNMWWNPPRQKPPGKQHA